jgi:hypothetical protein
MPARLRCVPEIMALEVFESPNWVQAPPSFHAIAKDTESRREHGTRRWGCHVTVAADPENNRTETENEGRECVC